MVQREVRCSMQAWDPWQICKQIALLQVAFYIGLYVLELVLVGVIPPAVKCPTILIHQLLFTVRWPAQLKSQHKKAAMPYV